MAIKIVMKITGMAELLAGLQRAQWNYPGATASAVYTESLGILRRARPNVPVDTSFLVNSEWCSLPDPTSRHPVAHMGYSAPYSLPVHERDEVKHRVGKAGWLRDAINVSLPGYARRLLARIISLVKAGQWGGPQPDGRIPTEPNVEQIILSKVRSHLHRRKDLSSMQKALKYGKVQKLLDTHLHGARG